MAYCLYLRKSRADLEAELHGDGETLIRHEKALLDLAKRKGIDITEIYREVVSGDTIAARPVMQQLLTAVEQGAWEGVLVMDIDRLARGDTIDQGIVAQTFKYSDTLIITPAKVYDPNNEFDEEYFEFGLFMSRREYKTINRRLQRGRLASINEGKWVSSTRPYGYKRVKLPDQKGWTLEPIPEEAEVVRLMFSLYTRGERQPDGSIRHLGFAALANKLNELNYKPMRDGLWTSNSVSGILKNPVYIGKVRWNYRPDVKHVVDGKTVVSAPIDRTGKTFVVDGIHPPIVDENDFYLAQDIINNHPPRPIGISKTVSNPLSGIVVCGLCGHKMLRHQPSKNGQIPSTLYCPYPGCKNISSYLDIVEGKILEGLRSWIGNYEIDWGNVSEQAGVSSIDLKRQAIENLDKEMEDLRKRREKIYDLLESGVYSSDDFLTRSRAVADKLDETTKKRKELAKELDADIADDECRRQIIPKVQNLLDVYANLQSAEAKNDLLKGVLEKVIYIKTKDGRWHSSPDDFEITLYPKLPKRDF